MRLGDLDALREEFAPETMCGDIAREIIDAAPTVSCEECEHWAEGGLVNEYPCPFMHSAPEFGCVLFQRRQP